MDNFMIRLAANEDVDKVLSLMQACFGEREFLTKVWYEWFNFSCPTGFNRNYIAIEKATGNIAGGYGLLPIKIKINDQVVVGSLCTNVMTHPHYQGRGLFTQMGRYCLSAEKAFQSRLTLGVPNESACPGHMKVGWKMFSDLTFIAKFSFRNKSCKSKEVLYFDTRVDQVIRQVAEQANFMVIKDHRFLNWRYQQRPDKDYRLFIFENKSNVDGYMVLKYFDDNGYKKTHVLDIVACSEEAFDSLILTAERCAAGRHELSCWMVKNCIYESFFTNNHFNETERKNILIMHANYGQDIEPKPSNWWFSLGDNDAY